MQSAEITSGVFKSGGNSFSIAYASAAKSSSSMNDDVISLKERGDGLSLLVADGASGFGFGHIASQALSAYFQTSFEVLASSRKAKRFLIEADEAVRQACSGEAEGADQPGSSFRCWTAASRARPPATRRRLFSVPRLMN